MNEEEHNIAPSPAELGCEYHRERTFSGRWTCWMRWTHWPIAALLRTRSAQILVTTSTVTFRARFGKFSLTCKQKQKTERSGSNGSRRNKVSPETRGHTPVFSS